MKVYTLCKYEICHRCNEPHKPNLMVDGLCKWCLEKHIQEIKELLKP